MSYEYYILQYNEFLEPGSNVKICVHFNFFAGWTAIMCWALRLHLVDLRCQEMDVSWENMDWRLTLKWRLLLSRFHRRTVELIGLDDMNCSRLAWLQNFIIRYTFIKLIDHIIFRLEHDVEDVWMSSWFIVFTQQIVQWINSCIDTYLLFIYWS